MLTKEFNCFACGKIKVIFTCPTCGKQIEQNLSVPAANLDGDRESFRETAENNYDTVICDDCNCEFNFTIQSSTAGGFLYIDNLGDEDSIEIEELSS